MSPNSAEMPPPVELTLVVAATRSMGIGRNGTLPWTGLKKEMAYFARVTKRVPSTTDATGQQDPSNPQRNAVIMGRKTWDSIPSKFRPLKDRLNIVISRSHTAPTQPTPEAAAAENSDTEPVRVASLDQAITYLKSANYSSGNERKTAGGRAFVIGGAQIYAEALKRKEARRVLLTSVASEFECDTFFPIELTGQSYSGSEGESWAQRSKAELDQWAGETVPEGIQEENGTQYEFQMWEKVDT